MHRSLYDLFASERVQDKEAVYRRLMADYLSKPEAITPHRLDHHGKLWSFAESKSFRDTYPKFNSQIWAYHWLQAAVYDVQLSGDAVRRRERMPRVIEHYHAYLRQPPLEWQFMPMMAEGAPEFAARFPEAAAIFDNLHMLHDNVDDALARTDLFPTLPAKRKRLLELLAIYLHRHHASVDRYADYHAPAAGEHAGHGQPGSAGASPSRHRQSRVRLKGGLTPEHPEAYSGRASLLASRAPAYGPPLSLPSAAEGDAPTIQLTAGVTVIGRVIDTKKEPLPDVIVAIADRSSFSTTAGILERFNAPLPKATTQADGTFHVQGIEPGQIQLDITSEGYRPERKSIDARPPVVDLKDITLRTTDENEAGTLMGQVIDELGKSYPSANCSLACVDSSTAVNAFQIADALGHFVFENLPEGTYTLTVGSSTLRDNNIWIPVSQKIGGLRPGQPSIPVIFDLSGQLQLRVVNALGDPVRRFQVSVQSTYRAPGALPGEPFVGCSKADPTREPPAPVGIGRAPRPVYVDPQARREPEADPGGSHGLDVSHGAESSTTAQG